MALAIILTGGSGFVGKNLKSFFANKQVVLENLSLRDTKWKTLFDNKATAIIHLAGKAPDTSHRFQEREYFEVNQNCHFELKQIIFEDLG